MTATTPIYGLSYPEGSDLVSSAAGSFKAMADTFETALDTVDRRSTPAGATPVIATTLESLKAQTATVGQTGFVTSDGDNTGPYIWDGTSWHHAHWYTADDKAKTTLVNKSGWKCEYMMKHGFVYVTVNLSDSGTKGWSESQMPGTLPEEARPPLELNFRTDVLQQQFNRCIHRQTHRSHRLLASRRRANLRQSLCNHDVAGRMTDLIIAIVGAVGAVVGALVSTLSAAAKNKMEAYRLAQKMQADNQRLWQWNRQLIDHIYRRAPPPPPEPPEDLFN